MVKQTKTTSTGADAAGVTVTKSSSSAAPPAVVAAAAAAAPKSKSSKSGGASKSAAATAAAAAAPAPAVPAAEKATRGEESVSMDIAVGGDSATGAGADASFNLASKRAEFAAKVQQICNLTNSLRNDYKLIDRHFERELRNAQKSSRRKVVNTGNRQPVGFTKPTLISDDLATFIGLEKGKEISRVEVCKMLYKYIKDHKLQDTTNGRVILPDARLARLLNIEAKDKLTYFNLQSFLKTHFRSVGKVDTATASAV